MAKKKTNKQPWSSSLWSDKSSPKLYNQEVVKRNNKYSLGSWFKGATGDIKNWNEGVTNKFMGSNFGQGLSNLGIGAGNLGGIANTAATAIGGALAGGKTSGVGNALQGIGSLASNIPGVGGLIGAGVNLLGGLTNATFGSKLNAENIAAVEGDIKQALNFTSNASNYDALASNYAELEGVMGFDKGFIGSDGIFSNKAKKKYKSLKKQAEEAEAHQLLALAENAQNIAATNQQLMEANYNAYGGIINRFDNGGNTESIYDTTLKSKNKYRSLTGKPNEFLDTWNQARLNTGRFDNQLGGGLMEAQKESRDSAPVFNNLNTYSKVSAIRGVPLFILGNETPEEAVNRFKDERAYQAKKIHNRIISNEKEQGEYNKDSHTIFYDPMGQNPMSTLLHEQSHASKAKPQESVIKDIILKNKEYNDTYKDDESEIYSRLMQVREANQIDPNKVWDEKSLKEFKKTATDFNFLNRYSDDTILDIFNNVAANDLPKDNGLFPDLGFESHLAAYGGPIHIKTSKRGTFTAAAKKRGMGVQEFASKILANKEDYSPAMVKKANFARNASKWKHVDGGQLFTNGVTMVGNGGTHEQNPMEGVPMGIDPNGIPNLVEEGEVIFNDYVFSNRLNVPDAVREKYKLRGNKKLTFADAAKQMQKESEERPNDPISKRGLESAMLRLQQAQESVREEKQASQEGRQYAHGGKMGILFDGLGEDSNWLYTPFGSPTREDILMEAGISDTNTGTNSKSSRNLSWLRYAPVVGAAIGLGQNLLSKPDYSSPNAVLAAAERAGTYTPVKHSPIGNYLTYTPFDRDYYINKLNADTAASRRRLVNTSGGNRAAAMAGILASDYNYGNQLGALARQAEEYNLAQRQAVEQFNRATNMANAEMGLKAAMANQEAALNAGKTRLSGTAQAMAMRDEIAARRGASMSANLTNLFDSLGNIGIDEMNRADRDMLIRAGVFGTLSEKPKGWSNKRWEDYKKTISGKGYSRGGQLKKKRGGFTY